MKKLITENDVIKKSKDGSNVIIVTKNDVITPLALDRIKILGMEISREVSEPVKQEKPKSFSEAKNKTVAIGCDHTGFQLKLILIKYLTELNFKIIDAGTFNDTSCDYPDFAIAVAKKVLSNDASFGVIIDATGIPSAITANKFNKIRAATCYNEFSAKSAREHNDANILVVGAKTLGEESVKSILLTFLNSSFNGGRHQRRLDKISELEKLNFKNI